MPQPSSYAALGGELCLSNFGQLELVRGMMEQGVGLRTSVRGSSMFPFVQDRDVLTIDPMRDQEPSVGDMVAFIMPGTGRLTVHRVVARRYPGWLLRGDTCHEADGIVGRDHILGRVVRVERRGRDVRLGLSVGAAWIAELSRTDQLARLSALLCLPSRGALVLRRMMNALVFRSDSGSATLRKRAGAVPTRPWYAVRRSRR